MINAIRKSFGWQLDEFRRSLQEDYHKESPDSGFAHYVFYRAGVDLPFSVAKDVEILDLESNRLNEAPTIAAVGYGLVCGRKFNQVFLENWSGGLIRLSNREVFTRDRASFFYRPTELLGIALGARYLDENESSQFEWFKSVLVEGEQRLVRNDFWTFLLSAYAARIFAVDWKPKILVPVEEMPLDDLALIKWICTIDPDFAGEFGLKSIESTVNKALLNSCIHNSILVYGNARTALIYFSLERTTSQVIQSCWEDLQEMKESSQSAIDWMIATCNKFHDVAQYLQNNLSDFSISETLDIRTLSRFEQLLLRLSSDINYLQAETHRQIEERSPLSISGNQVIVNTGDYVTMTSNQDSTNNSTNINAPYSNIGFINSGSGKVSDFSQNIGQSIDDIYKLIDNLREVAKQFPEDTRIEAFTTLDDLQEDIANPAKQKPERIAIRLRRLVIIAGAIAGFVAGAVDFTNNVVELHERLNVPVPVELSQLKLNQQ